MPTNRTTLREFLTAQESAETQFLAALVREPSDNPPGDCAKHAELTATLLEAIGFTVERHKVPTELARKHGMISATNLIIRHRYGPGPTVALNAHGDVVPPGTGWTTDPYGAEIRDGWMYGRGAAVSKSDIATYAFAMLALAEAGLSVGTLELHVTYDEETGGEIGPKYLLETGLSKPDLALGAGFSYQVVEAHNGCLHLEIDVTGRSAHAAKPYTGIDALEAATHILSTLYSWRGDLAHRVSKTPGIGAPQLTVGLIQGGINTNVVPDRVTIRLDRRITPEESPADVEADRRARASVRPARRHPRRCPGARRPAGGLMRIDSASGCGHILVVTTTRGDHDRYHSRAGDFRQLAPGELEHDCVEGGAEAGAGGDGDRDLRNS